MALYVWLATLIFAKEGEGADGKSVQLILETTRRREIGIVSQPQCMLAIIFLGNFFNGTRIY